MSASAPISCPAGQWTKVATNVTSATIHKLSVLPGVYKQTYVATGAAAPANDNNAVVAFGDCDSFIFSESTLSDVYIKAVGAVGSVRTDG
jgi:hypothetical protein